MIFLIIVVVVLIIFSDISDYFSDISDASKQERIMKQRLKQQEFQEKLRQKQDLHMNELQLGLKLPLGYMFEAQNE